jgi:hypothetical protein
MRAKFSLQSNTLAQLEEPPVPPPLPPPAPVPPAPPVPPAAAPGSQVNWQTAGSRFVRPWHFPTTPRADAVDGGMPAHSASVLQVMP